MADGPVRIADVARRAKVSVSTVSRAISHPDMVSAETRAAVEAAARDLGWRRNSMARNLRLGRSGVALALSPNFANAHHAGVLAGVAEGLRPAGLALLAAGLEELPRALDPRRADGVIVLDSALGARLLAAAGGRFGPRPVIATEAMEDSGGATVFRVNGGPALEAAVNHLVSLGHRRIGCVSGLRSHATGRAREGHVRDALAAHGLPLPEGWILGGAYSLAAGRAAAARWLAMPADARPTAMMCAADDSAVGFASEIFAAGLSVPEDVSLIGFDDIPIAAAWRTPLSTIRQPRVALGRAAGAALAARIAGRPAAPQTLMAELVLRASCAPPPGESR